MRDAETDRSRPSDSQRTMNKWFGRSLRDGARGLLIRKGQLAYGSMNKWPGGYRSGQTGQTVNLMAPAFAGSNPAPPIGECLMTNDEMVQRFRHWVFRHSSCTQAGVAQC